MQDVGQMIDLLELALYDSLSKQLQHCLVLKLHPVHVLQDSYLLVISEFFVKLVPRVI